MVTVNSFSKSYAMTGWRLGYVTGPSEILDGMVKIYQHSATCVTAFAQAGALEALTSAESRAASAADDGRLQGAVRPDLDLILARSEFFDCVPPQGAFYTLPLLQAGHAVAGVCDHRLLEEAHVATVPGSAFGALRRRRPCGCAIPPRWTTSSKPSIAWRHSSQD